MAGLSIRGYIIPLLMIPLTLGIINSQDTPGAVIHADPSNYRGLLKTLKAGDTLQLAPGTYSRLFVYQLTGTPAAWITIAGPLSGPPAVIMGERGRNTVEIQDSSYVSIENFTIDSKGYSGVFGISAKDGQNNLVHDIRIEGNVLKGQDGSQQTVGISTKTPTWGWIIRYNQILGAGTGLYLGSSDGTQPFVAGLIENNLVQDTTGYNMEIKDQIFIPSIPGMPSEPTSTIIRNNVFIKNDKLSPDGDRPNVILGAFPVSGTGSINMYEVYGNYFLHNHREGLFQASGRISLHDNIFVDGPYSYPAVVLRSQNYPLKIAYVYHNTVYTSERGIQFGSRAEIDDAVVGNLVFGLTPISGPIQHQSDNIVDSIENAPRYVHSPSFGSESSDFYPKKGQCQGKPIDLTPFHTNADYSLDFGGVPKVRAKGAVVFRGAYAGEGTNPGWQIEASVKPPRPPSVNQAPTLVWIDPPSVQAGTTNRVTLVGAKFTSEVRMTVSGDGVQIGNLEVSGATRITANLVIAPNATAGTRDVTINRTGGASNIMKLIITGRRTSPKPAPGGDAKLP